MGYGGQLSKMASSDSCLLVFTPWVIPFLEWAGPNTPCCPLVAAEMKPAAIIM